MNLFAYYSPDFYSDAAPACGDGNTGETLRGGGIRWERAIGFTDPANLVEQVASLAGDDARDTGRIDNLGILCHGRPGGLRLLADRQVLRERDLATHGARFRALATALTGQRGASGGGLRRPVVTMLACAAAADRQGLAFFELLSSWMPGVTVVAFTRLLRSASVTPRDLGDGTICLPPDIAVSEERYDDALDIAAQGGDDGIDESTLPGAGPDATHAVSFVNGRRVGRPRAASSGATHRRPTRAGRGSGSDDTAPGTAGAPAP